MAFRLFQHRNGRFVIVNTDWISSADAVANLPENETPITRLCIGSAFSTSVSEFDQDTIEVRGSLADTLGVLQEQGS